MDTFILMATILFVVMFIEVTFLTITTLRQRRLKVARGSILLDTSAIMDGRIVEVAKTGIITAELIIPRSVVREMQLLADKADHDKRVRARQGMDNIRTLQRMDSVSVAIVNDGLVDAGGVDERLLEIAKKYDAAIATTDYNLNKVAKVINLTVINVNELAQALRAQILPGETTSIELIQAGANREQAVGYLSDGTMVVVEDSRNLIGQTVAVEIVRSLQTEAGRMMFAKRTKSTVNKNDNNNKKASPVVSRSNLVRSKVSRSNRSTLSNSGDNKEKAGTGKISTAPSFHSESMVNKELKNNSISREDVDAKSNKRAKSSAVKNDPDTKNANKTNVKSTTKRNISKDKNVDINNNKSPKKESKNESQKTKSTTRRRSQRDAEASLVRLANKNN